MVETSGEGSLVGPRAVTAGGLVVCAVGIATLWASGVEFPVAIPPGGENTTSSSRSEIVLLLIGALFVAQVRWRWAPDVGAFLGLVFTVGFLVRPV
jgi:hypothetical protein